MPTGGNKTYRDKEDLYFHCRPELTDAQRDAADAAAKEVDAARKTGDQAAVDQALDKQRRLYMSWAVRAAGDRLKGLNNSWSAGDVRETGNALPTEEDAYIRFPGVDPRGKYCAVDMAFAERKERINVLLQSRSPEVARRIADLMESEDFRKLERALDTQLLNYRRYALAEKLCHDNGARLVLQSKAKDYLATEAQANMEDALTGVEYLLGLRDGPLPESTRRVMSSLGQSLEAEDVAECRAFVRPEQPTIVYPDYDDQLRQIWFSKPENWGKPLDQFSADSLTPQELGAHAYHYARGTADRTLGALFSHAEGLGTKSFQEYDNPRCFIDRADHIIIGGRTPREIMVEEYNGNRGNVREDYPNFNAYFIAKGHERTAELVGAALTADERVEVFIPDERGCVRPDDQPWRLSADGFEREKLPPVTLNLWERFWNHFGFYREKAAQAAQDAQFAAARERVRDYNTVARTEAFSEDSQQFRDQFFGDWLKDPENQRRYHGELPAGLQFNARGYSFTRSAWHSFAAAQLLMDIDAAQLSDNPDIPKDVTFRDVFEPGDPDKLRSARQKAGKKVIELFGQNDPQKEVRFFRTADTVLRNQIDRMTQAIDFTDPAAYTSPEMLPLFQMFDVAFDMSQETDHIKPDYNLHMNTAVMTPAKGAEQTDYAAELSERFGAATDVGRAAQHMMKAQSALLSGEIGLDGSQEILEYFTGVMTIQHYAALAKNNPGKPLTELATSVSPLDPNDPNSPSMIEWQKVATGMGLLPMSDAYQGLVARFKYMPEARAHFLEAVSSGRLMKECSFQWKSVPDQPMPQLEVKMPDDLFPPLPPEVRSKLDPNQAAAEKRAEEAVAAAKAKPNAPAKAKPVKKAPAAGPGLG